MSLKYTVYNYGFLPLCLKNIKLKNFDSYEVNGCIFSVKEDNEFYYIINDSIKLFAKAKKSDTNPEEFLTISNNIAY